VTPEARRARGIAAKAMIEDETLQAGWAELENELREKLERSPFPRIRDRYWAQLKHVRALRGKLASYAGQAPRD
jgi:hypothetical protein